MPHPAPAPNNAGNRPALSRWQPGFAEAFATFVKDG
jgi:hypothetical protein